MKKSLLLFLLLSFITYSFDINSPINYKIRAFYDLGKTEGFVQIPKGGKNGTTSLERPTYKELGIKNINFPEFVFQSEWNKTILSTGLKYKTFQGNNILTKDLVSHGIFIPANSKIDTKHEYIKYNLSLGYKLFDLNCFNFTPIIEFSINHFSYKYSAKTLDNNIIESGRSFDWGQLNIGLSSLYQLRKNIDLELNLKYGITPINIREYYSLEFISIYKLNQTLSFLSGIECEKMKFRDTQSEKQNYIKYFDILYKIGIEKKF